jgi:hypothetical protein
MNANNKVVQKSKKSPISLAFYGDRSFALCMAYGITLEWFFIVCREYFAVAARPPWAYRAQAAPSQG